MGSKSLSHTRWKCQYHMVFIPKYRKKQLCAWIMYIYAYASLPN